MDVADIQTGPTRVVDNVGVKCQKLFHDFLEEFEEDGVAKYIKPALEIAKATERSTLVVNFEDVYRYNENLSDTIIEEYYRVYPYLCRAVGNFIKDRGEKMSNKKSTEFYVSFTDVPTKHRVRELTMDKLGTLVRITGQVVRTHPVHPELTLGTFICSECQTIMEKIEQQFKYTQPKICRNPVCNNNKKFILQIDKCQFVDFQKVIVQETQAELPRGCIPRSMEIILREENVESIQAGGRYDFTGTLIVVPDVRSSKTPGAHAQLGGAGRGGNVDEGVRGLKDLGVRDLTYKLAFLACSVIPTHASFGSFENYYEHELTPELMKQQMSEAEWNKMYNMSRDKNLYKNLIDSLFPSIHGNDEVKKGILLMLFGGVKKTTEENTQLRGDINCCIVGDPSTAKSQFLKQVVEICPRAVYTSGKASSAAGLTAAVVKDSESFDFVIEAGALMLADNGLCCIDEFDKMDPRDQVAIHEAMEQQTISIAKAGVRATLNARTAILAAANPIGGRYDRTKSLQQNISLTAPIMSRFDLFFVLIDECNEVVDYAIARKVVNLHSNEEEEQSRVYTQDEVMRYIAFAKQFQPILNAEAVKLMVKCYTTLRQKDTSGGVKSSFQVTVRQLESMIRLAEAMAKMECSDVVKPKHVQEAYRLLNKSIIRVEQPDIMLDENVDDSVNAMDVDEAEPQDEQPETDDNPASPDLSQRTRTKITFEEYNKITYMLVHHIEKFEAEHDGIDGEGVQGIKKSQLIEWYLEEIHDSIDTEQELIERKTVVEKVIDRLLYKDGVLVPLRAAGQSDDTEESEGDDPFLVVHPNYVPIL